MSFRIASVGTLDAYDRRVLKSQIAPILLAHVRNAGKDMGRVVAEFGLPDSPEEESDLALSLPRFRELCEVLAVVADDPFLGLHAAIDLRRGTYGVVEFLMRSAATANDSLRALVDFVPLTNNLLRFSMFEEPSSCLVQGWIDDELTSLGRQANDFVLAIFVRLGRQLVGERWAPERVFFAHARPADVRPLVDFFGTDALSFDNGFIGVRVANRDRTRRVVTGDEALHAFLDDQAREKLRASAARDELEPLREAIRQNVRSGDPSVPAVAKRLGTSPRTLQRQLKERGTTFRALTDDVRHALALAHLADAALSLSEIAHRLAYRDSRAFGRAYKRWTGRSPGTARVRPRRS